MVIRKIGIVNVQLVKGNFATRKHYHLKLSTCKFINFHLIKTQLATRKIISLNLQLVKRNSQLAKRNLQLILFPTLKMNLQLVKLLCRS